MQKQLQPKFLILLLTLILVSCSASKSSNDESYKYLALGDSYTIGEGVQPNQRWPVMLSNEIRSKGIALINPKIIAKTGWRTDELAAALNEDITGTKKYHLVSLMIGVNNQFQHKSIRGFEGEIKGLIQTAVAKCVYGTEGVMVLSIPDYGVTPFAGEKGKAISRELKDWNAVIERVSREMNVQYFDITLLSQKAEKDPSLLAADALHPGPKMYKEWVDLMAESVYVRLKANIRVYSKK